MNKRELAEQLAKEAHKSRAKAADEVDSLVYGLLKDMKETSKQSAKPPGTAAPKPPPSPSPKAKR